MANDLVPSNRNPIVTAGTALSRAISSPELSETRGGLPRTILLGRMLAGASDVDLLMAHFLCLPQSETYGIALFGEPAGPTFKTHPAEMSARFEPEDPGAVGTFIDWRYELGNTPVIASFDPSCARSFVQAVEILNDQFQLPIDVIFLAAKDEGMPPLVKRIRTVVGKVIVARRKETMSKFEKTEALEFPSLPRILAKDYVLAQSSLIDLVKALPNGSRELFRSELREFSSKLEALFDE